MATSTVTAPTVSVKKIAFSAKSSGAPIAVDSLFVTNGIDPKDPITGYTFFSASGAGYFLYNNKKYDGVDLKVAASELSSVKYVPVAPSGAIKSNDLLDKLNSSLQDAITQLGKLNPGSTDSIKVTITTVKNPQGVSGTGTVKVLANWAPRVKIIGNDFVWSQSGKKQGVSSLITTTDLDRDPVVKYRFVDSNSNSASGYFSYNNTSYQGKTLEVAGSELGNVSYVPGSPNVADTISVSVNDGLDWSDVASATWKTIANRKPVTINQNKTFSRSSTGQQLSINTLFAVADDDKDAMSWYNFFDGNKDPNSGYFVFKGKPYQGQQLNQVFASDLGQLYFVPGKPGQSDAIWIGACDGGLNSDWATATWSTKANNKPVVTIKEAKFSPGSANTSMAVTSLISYTDADADPAVNYTLKNSSSDNKTGYFLYNSNKYQGSDLTVSGADLAKVSYVTGQANTSETITVVATDGFDTSTPASSTWSTQPSVTSFSKDITLGLNKTFSLGDLLGVPNEKKFSVFLGPDVNLSNKVSDNFLGTKDSFNAGIKASTGGSDKIKVGLDVNGGYSLGSLTVAGGAQGRLDYNSSTGLKLSGGIINPRLDLSLPYAYLNMDAIAQVALNPKLSAYYNNLPWPFNLAVKGSDSFDVPLPSLNINSKTQLVNLDTRTMGYAQTLNLGNLFATSINLPSFTLPTPLSSIPSSIASQSTWNQGVGTGVAYGISGTQNLMSFSLSASQIAGYLGLPLGFDFNLFNGMLSGSASLVDAKIGANSDLSYSTSVAIKPNVYMTVEGSTTKWEVKDGLAIASSLIKDLNGDKKISVTVQADPIIGANASVKVKSSLTASVDSFTAKATADIGVLGIHQDVSIGPLTKSGPINLGTLGDISLFDQTFTKKLSDFAPDWQKQLVYAFDIPLA